MTSLDDILKKNFNEIVTHFDCKGNNNGEMLDVILQWFRSLLVFERLQINETDVEEVLKSVNGKVIISGESFLEFLQELAIRTKIEVEKLKVELTKLMNLQQLEKDLKGLLQAGKSKGNLLYKEVIEILKEHGVTEADLLRNKDIFNVFKMLKDTVGTANVDEIVKSMGNIVAKWEMDLSRVPEKSPDDKKK